MEDPKQPWYALWHRDQHLYASNGSQISHIQVANDVIADIKKFGVEEVCLDPRDSTYMEERIQAETDAETITVPQQAKTMSTPMKALEAAILDNCIAHNGNPVMTWAISNVQGIEDRNRDVRPSKPKDKKQKIDPATAIIIAMTRAMNKSEEKFMEYTGLKTVNR